MSKVLTQAFHDDFMISEILSNRLQKPPDVIRLIIRMFISMYANFTIVPFPIPANRSDYEHPDDIWFRAEFPSVAMRRLFMAITAKNTPLDGIEDFPLDHERENRRIFCQKLVNSAASIRLQAAAQLRIINSFIAAVLSRREKARQAKLKLKLKIKQAMKPIRREFYSIALISH